MAATKKSQSMTLEEILQRLDEISQKLDSDLPLDTALSLYEEGVKLIKEANALIENAESKIKTLNPQNLPEENENA